MLSDIKKFRYKIGDSLRQTVENKVCDGVTALFQLSHSSVQDLVLTLDNIVVTDLTLNPDVGTVLLGTAPNNGETIRVQYNYAAFTDDEINDLIEEYVTVNVAAIEALKILLADSARRFDYTHGQTDMKVSQVFDHLNTLLTTLKTEQDSVNAGPQIFVKRISPEYEGTRQSKVDLSRSDLGL